MDLGFKKLGQELNNGWEIFKASIKVFNKHPIFLVPIFIVWLLYAPVIIYLRWFSGWTTLPFLAQLKIAFVVIFFFALLLTISCSILLELVQQIESHRKKSLLLAFWETINKNLFRITLLALIWSVLWLILIVIESFLTRKEESGNGKGESFNAQNVAATLGGYDSFSWKKLSFDLIHKGIRMIVFLIMPAFAWENLGFIKSVKKGLFVLKSHFVEFATGISLTYLAASVIFIPPAILLTLARLHIFFPDWVWYITIIYIAFAWSYSIYLEQMFSADLYLWHMKWEKACRMAKNKGKKKLPKFKDIPKPSILDDVKDLV